MKTQIPLNFDETEIINYLKFNEETTKIKKLVIESLKHPNMQSKNSRMFIVRTYERYITDFFGQKCLSSDEQTEITSYAIELLNTDISNLRGREWSAYCKRREGYKKLLNKGLLSPQDAVYLLDNVNSTGYLNICAYVQINKFGLPNYDALKYILTNIKDYGFVSFFMPYGIVCGASRDSKYSNNQFSHGDFTETLNNAIGIKYYRNDNGKINTICMPTVKMVVDLWKYVFENRKDLKEWSFKSANRMEKYLQEYSWLMTDEQKEEVIEKLLKSKMKGIIKTINYYVENDIIILPDGVMDKIIGRLVMEKLVG